MADEQELKLKLKVGVEDNASGKIKGISDAAKEAEKEVDKLKETSDELKEKFGDLSDEAERLAAQIGKTFDAKSLAQAKKLSNVRRSFNDTNNVDTKAGMKLAENAKTVSELADAFTEMSAGQASSMAAYSNTINKVENGNKTVKKATGTWDKFTKSIGKIVLYRAVRRAMSDIAKSAQEGMDNYYKYMMMTGEMANVKNRLDSLSASGYTVSNSLGVTLSSALALTEPLLSGILYLVTDLNESLGTLIAMFNGSMKVTKVNKEYMKQYAEQVKKATGALQGFDEINNITTGKNGFDYSKAFTTENISAGDIAKSAAEVTAITAIITAITKWRKKTQGITSDMETKNGTLSEQSELTEKETETVSGLSKALSLVPIGVTIGLLGGLGDALNRNKNRLGEQQTELGNTQSAYENLTEAVKNYKTELQTVPEVASNKKSQTATDNADNALDFSKIKAETVAGYNASLNKSTSKATSESTNKTEFNNTISNPVIGAALGVPSVGGIVTQVATDKIMSSSIGQKVMNKVIETTDKVEEFFTDNIPSALRSFGEGALRGALSGFTGGMLPAFADGGFPQSGSLFIAGESGAELLGTVGGRTAVAGGNEITGIREAIYDVADEIVTAIQNQEKLEINTRRLFKSMQSEAAFYTRSTGRPAY